MTKLEQAVCEYGSLARLTRMIGIISKETVRQIVAGERIPDPVTQECIAHLVGYTVDQLWPPESYPKDAGWVRLPNDCAANGVWPPEHDELFNRSRRPHSVTGEKNRHHAQRHKWLSI